MAFRGYYIPTDERDDVVQEVVLQVYRAATSRGFRVDQSFERFVRTVAHRRCVDWMRGHRSTSPLNPSLVSEDSDPERRLLSREAMDRGRRVLRSLSFACAQLVRLRLVEGLTYRAISARLGRTEGSVRVHLHKCLKKARAVFELENDTVD